MGEVITCRPCGTEFHQSFLSAHVEAFHVQERKEEIICLSCLTCGFSVSSQHKNTMAQHCLVSGHNPDDVEVQFNSFLLSERQRFAEILKASLAILLENLEEEEKPAANSTMKKTVIKETNNELFSLTDKVENVEEVKKPTVRLTKKNPITKGTSSELLNMTDKEGKITLRKRPTKDYEAKSQPSKYRKQSEFQPDEDSQPEFEPIKNSEPKTVLKEEIVNESTERDMNSAKISCTQCRNELSLSKRPSHKLQIAVGHVMSHLPHLKLYRCLQCGFEMGRKSNAWNHMKKHNVKLSEETCTSLGTEENALTIRKKLDALFPNLKWNKTLDVLKYL